MPFCRKCGNQLDEQASFCPRCGTPVNQQLSRTPQLYKSIKTGPFPIVPIVIIVGVLILALVLMPFLLGWWSPLGSIVGSGDIVTREQPFSGFTSVVISSGFDFVITQSNSFNVQTTTYKNIQDYVQISRTGNILSVELKPGTSITTSTLKVAITMPNLSRLELSGGAHGNAAGFVSTNNFEIEASGGSVAKIQGQANDLAIDASGGSQLNLSTFAVRSANVFLSGGSQAEVNATGRIDAVLSGGSRLYYSGNPTLGNIVQSGGATVQKR